MKRKNPEFSHLNVLGDPVLPPKTSRSQQSVAKKYFAKQELPKTVLYSEIPDGEKSKKPIIQDHIEYDMNDPMNQIGEVTEKIDHIVSRFEQAAEEDHMKHLQELDTRFQINSLDSKQILSESKNIVDELLNKNQELKNTQTSQLADVNAWMKKEQRSLFNKDDENGLGLLDTSKTEDPNLTQTSDEILNILQSSTGSKVDRASRALQIHQEFAAKTFLKMRELEHTIKNKQSEIADLKKLNEELLQNGSKRFNKKDNEQEKEELQKKLLQAQEKLEIQDETIKKLNTRINELIGQSVLVTIKNDENKDQNQPEDVTQLMQKNTFLDVKIQDLEATINKLNNQLSQIQHEFEMLSADKTLLTTQNESLSETNQIQKNQIEKLTNDILAMKDRENDQKNDLQSPDNILRTRIRELEDEIKKITQTNEVNLQKATNTYKKQMKDMHREYELREVDLRNRLIQEKANQSNNLMVKSVEDNYERKFAILEKQYQDKMTRQQEEHENQIKQLNEANQMSLKALKDQLNVKISDSDAAKILMKQLNDEKEQSSQREMLIKAQNSDKLNTLQQEFQEHIKKLEKQISDQSHQITKQETDITEKDKELEKLRAQVSDLEVQMETMSVNSKLNERDNADVVNSSTSVDSLFSGSTIDSRASTRSNESATSNAESADLDQIQRRIEQRFIRRMAQQKLALDKVWGQEMDKVKSQLEESEINNAALKKQLMTLEAQIDDKTHDEEMQQQINNLQNKLTELEKEHEELKSEKAKLSVENNFLQQAANAKDTDDVYKDLAQTFAQQTEEFNRTKAELDKVNGLYQQLLQSTAEQLNKQRFKHADYFMETTIIFSKYPSMETFKSFGPQDDSQFILSNSNRTMSQSYMISGSSSQSPLKLITSQKSVQMFATENSIVVSLQPDNTKAELQMSYIYSPCDRALTSARSLFVSSVQNQIDIDSDMSQPDVLTNPVVIQQPKPQVYLSEEPVGLNIPEVVDIPEWMKRDRQQIIYQFVKPFSLTIEKEEEKKTVLQITPINKSLAIDVFFDTKDVEMPEIQIPQTKRRVSFSSTSNEEHEKEQQESVPFAQNTTEKLEYADKETSVDLIPETKPEQANSPQMVDEDTETEEKREETPKKPVTEYESVATLAEDQRTFSNIAVMVNTMNVKPPSILDLMPALEVFTLEGEEITPEEPPIIDPYMPQVEEDKEEEKPHVQLMTNDGTYIDIPTMNEITPETDPVAVAAASQQRIDETKVLSKKLALVISEIQSIEEEKDPQKKFHLQNTVGVTLDIQKDSLISQMKERISELEQMNKRHTSNLSVEKFDELSIRGKSPEKKASFESHITQTSRPTTSKNITTSEMVSIQTDSSPEAVIEKKKSNLSINTLTNYDSVTDILGEEVVELESHSTQISRNTARKEYNDEETQNVPEYDSQFTQIFMEKPVYMDNMTQTMKLVSVNQVISSEMSNSIEKEQKKIYSTVETANETTNTEEQFEVSHDLVLETLNTYTYPATQRQSIEIETDKIERVDIGFTVEEMNTMKNRKVSIAQLQPTQRRRNIIVKVNDFEISPTKQEPDPRIAKFETQREQINTLKKQLLLLQNTQEANQLHAATEQLQQTLNEAGENMSSIATKGIFIPVDNTETETTTSALAAVKACQNISEKLIDNTESIVGDQKMFVEEMGKVIGNYLTKTANNSSAQDPSFVRSIGNLATEIANANAKIAGELQGNQQLKSAFEKALEQISKQNTEIQKLRQNLIVAQMTSVEPDSASVVRRMQSELEEMMYGKPDKNKLFKTQEQASKFIADACKRSKNNTLIQSIGAARLIESIEKQARSPAPQFSNIQRDLNTVVEMLNQRAFTRRSQELTNSLRDRARRLEDELSKQQTEKIIIQRDLSVARQTYANEKNQYMKRISALEDQSQILERQLAAMNKQADQALREAHESERNINDQLIAAKNELEQERANKNALDKKYNQLRERFDALFNQATDTETNNQALKARVEEIFTQAEITRKKCGELEKLVADLTKEQDELSNQLMQQINTNAELEASAENQKLKIAQLEQSVLDEQTVSQAKQNPTKTQTDIQKMIKIYKDKIVEWQTKMQDRNTETSALKQQKASDQKAILLLRREIQRLTSELKMSSLRYNSSKQEIQNLNRAVASREETIQLLKREIERLRNLLKKQEPLKQNLRVIDQMKYDTDMSIQKTKNEIDRMQRNIKNLATTPATSKYFDQLLDRQQRTLARLEKQRNDFKNQEMHARMMCLDAVSLLVKENELKIPEEVVLKYMPKPEPSKKIQAMQEKRKMEAEIALPDSPVRPKYAPNQQSYAEQLEILGSLANKVEPSALKGILRDARHRQIIVPTQRRKTKSVNGDAPPLIVKPRK